MRSRAGVFFNILGSRFTRIASFRSPPPLERNILMRPTSLLLAALLASAVTLPGHAADRATPDAERFGAVVTERRSVNLAKLGRKPASFTGKTLRIEGVVKDVCQGQGCWVQVQGAKGATFMAKSLDESVLLPKDCAGRRIVVQGVVTRLMPKGHDHDHEEGVPAHSCPTPSYVLSMLSAELVAKK